MKWSKLRKLVEETFADSVRGRVQVHTTAYQCSCGRGWITVDGEEAADLSTLVWWTKHGTAWHESAGTESFAPAPVPDEERTPGRLVEPGEFSRFDLHEACWAYLNDVSLSDALASENPLIASLAVLNARVGKNRMRRLRETPLHPLTRALLQFRMEAEGIA